MLCETFEWYDALVSCLNCGDQWSGGERLERPFASGWRERSVAQLERHLTTLAQPTSGGLSHSDSLSTPATTGG